MSERVFTGGQIDLGNLLAGLDGRPFQADIEELFSPFSGAPPQSRAGHVMVDSRGRSRVDIRQEGMAISFVHDPLRRVMLVGLGEEPDAWITTPDPLSARLAERPPVTTRAESADSRDATSDEVPVRVLGDEDEGIVEGLQCVRIEHASDAGALTTTWYSSELDIPVRITSVTPEGSKLFRLHGIRFEEPDPGSFPEEP